MYLHNNCKQVNILSCTINVLRASVIIQFTIIFTGRYSMLSC